MNEKYNKHLTWERRTLYPNLIMSPLLLFLLSALILNDNLSTSMRSLYTIGFFAIWGFFIFDYVVRLALHKKRLIFVKKNIIDFISLFIPLIRPFRFFAYLHKLQSLQGNSPSHRRRRMIIVLIVSVALFIYVISLLEYAVERHAPESNINSFGNTLWWAHVTMTTVGYGEFYPVTLPGRILAIVLMFGGVAVMGSISATVVSYLSEQVRRISPPETLEESETIETSTT